MSADQPPECQSAFAKLAGVVDGTAKLDRKERNHVEKCANCQLELGNYRKLLKSMQGLRMEVLEPNPGLLASILANVSERGEQHSVRAIISGRRVAYAGGIAVAAVAGVTGVVLLGRGKAGVGRAA